MPGVLAFGMRIRVTDVLELFAAGLSAEQKLKELPDLEPEDIQACLSFAARMLDHPVVVPCTSVQIRPCFQEGGFPSSHHREEGWPSDQENIAKHPLFASPGWCSDEIGRASCRERAYVLV